MLVYFASRACLLADRELIQVLNLRFSAARNLYSIK
jgi:hypothetical protein